MKAILLVPAPEWRDRLLGGGVCAASPPVAYEWPGEGWLPLDRLRRRTCGNPESDGYSVTGEERAIERDYRAALALAWDRQPVPEGIDRLLRVAAVLRAELRPAIVERVEVAARAVYEAFPGASEHPWVPLGNSARQADARCSVIDRVIASDRDQAIYEGVQLVLSAAYTPGSAMVAGAYAVRLGLGELVVVTGETP